MRIVDLGGGLKWRCDGLESEWVRCECGCGETTIDSLFFLHFFFFFFLDRDGGRLKSWRCLYGLHGKRIGSPKKN